MVSVYNVQVSPYGVSAIKKPPEFINNDMGSAGTKFSNFSRKEKKSVKQDKWTHLINKIM